MEEAVLELHSLCLAMVVAMAQNISDLLTVSLHTHTHAHARTHAHTHALVNVSVWVPSKFQVVEALRVQYTNLGQSALWPLIFQLSSLQRQYENVVLTLITSYLASALV